jgi:hypothetical protein
MRSLLAGSDVAECAPVATMADLDDLALALPGTTKELSADGRPTYTVHGKLFCCHRSRRRDAVDPQTGERLDDVLMFRVPDLDVKQLLLADERGLFFTTPHFDGYPAVLLRIPDLARLDRDELFDLLAEAWLTRAQKRVAKAWLQERCSSWGRRRLSAAYAYAAARSNPAISILPMPSMACITRCDFCRSGSASSSERRVGMICQEIPNLSFSQPHGPSSPPSERAVQYLSTSSWFSQSTRNEMASFGLKSGPPFSAANRCPSSSKLTVMTIPSGRGPAEP